MAMSTIDYDRMIEILNAIQTQDDSVLGHLSPEEVALARDLTAGMIEFESESPGFLSSLN